jgi:hypothetical protein
MMTLEIAMTPPIMDNVLGHSPSQNQAMIMAIAGSAYIMLVTALALPAESAIPHVT